MKLGKRYLACLVLAVVMVVSLGLFAACNNDKKPNDSSGGNNSVTSAGTQSTDTQKTPEELKGEYYCEDDDKKYTLSFEDNMAVKVNMGNGEKQAKFTFDGTKATWEVDGTSYSATSVENGNKVNLTVGKSEYTFWKNIEFTVTYAVNGGTKIDSSKALNGKPAKKPADPTKDGYFFVGWYKDAEFKEAYSFESDVITANTTIYAKYLEYFVAEFEVKLDLNYEGATALEPVTTVQNKLQYNLPTPVREGYKFVGWWLSDFNSAEKLTAKYVDQEIKQNTTLYAVWEEENKQTALYVSISEDKISWESAGVNVNYTVTVTKPTGEDSPQPVQKLTFDYAFKDAPAGEYIVKVTSSNGLEGVAYYNNKQLDTVNLFNVDEKTATLSWNAIENATNYYLTYTCGDENHLHENVSVNSTCYTFKNCEKPADGYKFTVKASASGYSSSTSETFTYNKALKKPGKVVVADGTMLSWEPIENAQYYEVYVGETKYTTLTNSLSLENHSGALEIKVVAKARTLGASEEATLTYTKEKLATPVNLTVNGGVVSWDEVSGATSYIVTIDGKEFTANTNSFTLSDTNFDNTKPTHVLTVQAKAATDATKSLVSNEINFTADTVNPLSFENGKVYWAVVNGATGYAIKVNDGEEVKVDANNYYADVRLTKAGNNEIKVAYLNAEGVTSAWATVTVEAVALRVDLAGAEPVSEDGYLYFKKGTYLNLNDITAMVKRDGYTFAGWYNKENGRNTNGARYYDDVPLVLNGEMTIYGAWVGKEYKVTLDLEGAKLDEGSELVYDVRMGDSFKLPVPYFEGDTTRVFMGWYSEPNGEGTQCTNKNGNSTSGGYGFFGDKTFYPRWANIFTFNEIASLDPNYEKAYSVSKGEAVNLVETVTVPVMYNGFPVTTVEANGFADCTNLYYFNIPNTILNVEATAFKNCNKLQEVNVYDAGATSPRYDSSQGVLFRTDNLTGDKGIAFIPTTKSGAYVIPDGVNVIPNEAFKNSKITEVAIPASVTFIGKDAFYDTSTTAGFTKITFLPCEEGKDEVPLYLAAGAFNYTKCITTIDLPARTALITDEGRWLYDVFGKNTTIDTVNIVGKPAVEVVTNSEGVVTKNEIKTYTSVDGVVYKDDGATLVYYPYKKGGEFRSDAGVTKIDEYAFAYNTQITKITIAGEVTEIGDYAFVGCSGVLDLVFEGVAEYNDLYIGRESFYGLTKVSAVVLPGNLKSVGLNAFGGCGNLTYVQAHFDDRVYEEGKLLINVDAFANRKSSSASATTSKTTFITTLYLGEHVPVIDINEIFGGSKLVKLDVDPKNPNYGTYQNDGVIYGKDADGNLENIAFYPARREGEYVVPTGIRTIGALVFNNKDALTKITIPHTVTRIGDDAFSLCDGLKEVVFLPTPETEEPKELVIGNRVFRSCLNIERISFPERTTQIGDAVFASASNLTTVDLPTTLHTLVATASGEGEDATYSMETFFTSTTGKLATINVAQGSKYFASIDGVLYSLREEKKTEGEQEVVSYVPNELITCPIQNGGNNGSVVIPATVNKIWDKAFSYNQLVKSISFEERTTNEEFTFGKEVFYNASKLENLELPYGLSVVKAGVFYGCSTIKELIIPQTVSLVEGYVKSKTAFSGCSGLERIIFLDDTEREKDKSVDLVIGDGKALSGSGTSYYGVFRDCKNLESVVFPVRGNKPVVVPETPTEPGVEPTVPKAEMATIKIGSYAFCGSPNSNSYGSTQPYLLLNLKEVVLTENVIEIGDYAFHGASLQSINLPNKNIKLGKYVFAYTKNLKTIDLYNGIAEITERMFYYSGIESISIPASVETISTYAFAGCSKLTNITFEKQEVTAEDGTVSSVTSLKLIDEYAFNNCKLLTSIELPESLTTINDDAFSYSGLTSINFPTNIETIGESFYGSNALTNITFAGTAEKPSNLKSIASGSFKNVPVENIAFPVSNSVIELGASLFGVNSTLKTVYLSESISYIADVFTGCNALNKITVSEKSGHFSADPNQPLIYNKEGTAIRLAYGEIGDTFTLFNKVDDNGNAYSTITEIGDNAFEGQTGIKSVVIPKTVLKIGDDAFNGCTGITELIFEKGSQLTTIGVRAFKGCTGLTEVQLPASIEYLYDYDGDATRVSGYQFAYCSNLAKVTFAPDSKILILGTYAFQNCVSLKEFEIPETVYRIDHGTFQGCTGLAEITLPAIFGRNNVTLGTNIFNGCKNLTTVHFPETAQFTYLPDFTFANCTSLKYSTIGDGEAVSFTLPDAITSIGKSAFEGCTALEQLNLGSATTTIGEAAFKKTTFKSITLPDTITTLGKNVFYQSGIEEVSLPAGLTSLGEYAFYDCPNLTTVTMTKATGLTKIAQYTFRNSEKLKYSRNEKGELVDFIIPNNITTIDQYAFANTGIEKITIPASLTKIGNYLFKGSLNLIEVDYQAEIMGKYMFQACTGITTVKFADNTNPSGGDYAFDGCIALQYSEYKSATDNKPFALPKNASIIPQYFLRDATAVTELTIPENVREIKLRAFDTMSSLKKVTFPETGSQLTATNGIFGNCLFVDCTSLTTVVNLPSALKTYGTYMFQNCTSLTEFTIPASWTKIPSSMFNGCVNLKTITFATGDNGKSSVESIEGSAFAECDSLVTVTIPDSVTAIKGLVFKGCDLLESVTLANPGNVTEFGSSVFENCVSLKSFVMPRKLHLTNTKPSSTSIFKNCVKLESVTFHKDSTLEKLPNSMFEGCTSLKSITIPSTITEIGDYVFRGCSSMTTATFGNVNIITKVGKEVFKGCSALKAIDLPANLEAIGESTFEGCASLATVNIPNGANYVAIPKNTFKGCAMLKSITLPSSVTTLADSAFEGAGLTSINLPASLATIGKNVFKDCVNLSSVTFNANVITEIPDYAFYNTANLTKIDLPTSVTKLGEYAFAKSGLVAFDIGFNLTEFNGTAFAATPDLVEFTVNVGNHAFTFENNMLLGADGELIVYLYTSIPANGTLTISKDMKLAPKAFVGVKNIQTVVIEDGITSVPEYAFYEADSIKSVVLPATVTSIGAYAFAECDLLESVSMANTVTTLGTKGVDKDGETTYTGYVFKNTPMLKNITLSTALEEIMPYTFDGSGLASIVLPDSLKMICDYGFFNANKLASVTFGANASYIGKYAFAQCLALPEITITGKDMVVNDYAFASVSTQIATTDKFEPMPNLKTVTLGEGVKFVGIAAFRGTGVETLNVGATVEVLGNYLFYKSETIKTVNFAENSKLNRLGSYAFAYCTGITTMTLPEGLEYLGAVPSYNATTGAISSMVGYTFGYCENLKTVKLPSTLKGMGTYTFRDCLGLTEVNMPGCEFFGNYMFNGCDNLVKVTIAEGATKVGGYMFQNLEKLTTVELPETITEIGTNAFQKCVSLKEIYIPDTIKKVNSNAFNGLTEETNVYFVAIAGPGTEWNANWNKNTSANFIFKAKPKAETQPQKPQA